MTLPKTTEMLRTDIAQAAPVSWLPGIVQSKQRSAASSNALCRQLLTFIHAPATAQRRIGAATVFIEIVDGRVFFMRVGTPALESVDLLIEQLVAVPAWISGLEGTAIRISDLLCCPIEFIESSPFCLEEWGIGDWARQAMSWAVIQPLDRSLDTVRSEINRESKRIRDELQNGLLEFLGNLDQVAVAHAEQAIASWCSTYNYYGVCNPRQKLYRRQARDTFPFVVRFMLQCPTSRQSESIRMAIDEGVPLVDAIADLFMCTKASVKHLNGLDVSVIGSMWDGKLKELLQTLSALDVNLLPRDQESWSVFSEGVELIGAMTKLPISALSSRLLLGELSKHRWARRNDAMVSFKERAIAIEEFGECVRRAIVTTAWSMGMDTPTIGARSRARAAESLCALGLTRLEKLSRNWKISQLNELVEVPGNDGSFPILLPNPIAVGDLQVVQLTDGAQLKFEARHMDNCVNGYEKQCGEGVAYIFSIRDAKGLPLVTIEYAFRKARHNLPELFLVQQKGYSNKEPPARCNEALRRLHEVLGAPEIRKRIQTLAIFRKGFDRVGKEMAMRFAESAKVVEFLAKELPGRIDFEQLAKESADKVL